MLRPWKFSSFDRLDIIFRRLMDAVCASQEILHEPGFLAGIDPQHVIQHQYLRRAIYSGANADGGNGQFLVTFLASAAGTTSIKSIPAPAFSRATASSINCFAWWSVLPCTL